MEQRYLERNICDARPAESSCEVGLEREPAGHVEFARNPISKKGQGARQVRDGQRVKSHLQLHGLL
jgi:hypothetical protein